MAKHASGNHEVDNETGKAGRNGQNARRAQTVQAEAAQRSRELLAHFNLALAVLSYARVIAELSEGQLAQIASLRGDLKPWRDMGERLRELSDIQLHELAAHVTSIQVANYAHIRETADLVLRARHPGITAASTLIAVLSRHVD